MKKLKVMFFLFIYFLLFIFSKKIIKKSFFFLFFLLFWAHFDQILARKRLFPGKWTNMFTWTDTLDNIKLQTSHPKLKMFTNNVFHQKGITDTLLTSPQLLSHDHFSPRYGQKRFLDADPYVAVQIITPYKTVKDFAVI